MPRLRIRIDFDPSGPDRQLGPGKIGLLEHVAETGSISAGGRAMGMSYRRAWLLIDSLNRCFREKVIETRHGGTQGGGAALTPFGQVSVNLDRRYQGTGLGLPLVKSLIELHGGRLEIESALGQGTRVGLCFPANRVERPLADSQSALPAAE